MRRPKPKKTKSSTFIERLHAEVVELSKELNELRQKLAACKSAEQHRYDMVREENLYFRQLFKELLKDAATSSTWSITRYPQNK